MGMFFLKIILYLFILSLGISKSGINIFGGIFAIASIMFLIKEKKMKKYMNYPKENEIFLLIFILGIFLNLISLGGIESTGRYIYKNFYFLMIPGLNFFFKEKETRDRAIYILLGSFSLGIIKSIYNFKSLYNFQYSNQIRVDSFYDIGRWGAISMFILLFTLPKIFDKKLKNKIRLSLGILWGFALFSLIINNSRGPWLSLSLGIFLYVIFYIDIKKIIAILVLMLLSIATLEGIDSKNYNNVKTKFLSITDRETNSSNQARFIMWQKAFEFVKDNAKNKKKNFYLGLGFNNVEESFENYIKKRNLYEEVMETKGGFSFKDHHNSYLNVLTQMGIIYFTVFWGFLFGIIYKQFVLSIKTKDTTIIGSFLCSVGFLFCGVFYGYIFTYEMFIYFTLLFLSINTQEKYKIVDNPRKNIFKVKEFFNS
jgi:O-antigen ligase